MVQAKLNLMMVYLVHHHIDCTKTSLNLTENLFAAPLLDKESVYEPDNVFFGDEKRSVTCRLGNIVTEIILFQ